MVKIVAINKLFLDGNAGLKAIVPLNGSRKVHYIIADNSIGNLFFVVILNLFQDLNKPVPFWEI
ncbi:hypothetical protein ACFL6Y_01370 [Elusimicrobiota bacterium]